MAKATFGLGIHLRIIIRDTMAALILKAGTEEVVVMAVAGINS